MPDYALEDNIGGIIAGVDEVGRGPWAGPVVAAAAIIDRSKLPSEIEVLINDSKQLTAQKRAAICPQLMECCHYHIAQASVAEIDQINIREATFLAMRRAIEGLNITPEACLIDGNSLPELPMPAYAVVKGDSTSLSIAVASIIAKEYRDTLMRDLATEYPGYGWETNAGYGTKTHQQGLADHGVTPHHRRSFAPIRARLQAAS
ncbi:MAG: ribonuclease HII [Alphaproteobacteria bacterium]